MERGPGNNPYAEESWEDGPEEQRGARMASAPESGLVTRSLIEETPQMTSTQRKTTTQMPKALAQGVYYPPIPPEMRYAEPGPSAKSAERARMHSLSSCLRSRDDNQRDDIPEEMRAVLKTIGYMSVSDTAFALKPFSGSANCRDKAEKWLEQFNRYTSFRKIVGNDKLQLFQLPMTDQASDWLNSLPDYKKEDITTLMDEFKKETCAHESR